MSNKKDKVTVVFRRAATWCAYCNKAAQYEAEARDYSAQDVCSISRHAKRLTGRYRRIRKMPGVSGLFS